MAAADERQRDLQRILVGTERAAQRREVLVGDGLQMVARDGDREIASRRVCVELRELQHQALAQRPRADARRIERLHEREHLLDVRLRDRQVGAQVLGDLGGGLRQVAVVVQRVDDRLADPDLARIEPADLQLPDQVLVQVAAAFVGELERAVVVVGAGAVAGRRRAISAHGSSISTMTSSAPPRRCPSASPVDGLRSFGFGSRRRASPGRAR